MWGTNSHLTGKCFVDRVSYQTCWIHGGKMTTDPYLRAGQRVGVNELEQWPNNWGLVNQRAIPFGTIVD